LLAIKCLLLVVAVGRALFIPVYGLAILIRYLIYVADLILRAGAATGTSARSTRTISTDPAVHEDVGWQGLVHPLLVLGKLTGFISFVHGWLLSLD